MILKTSFQVLHAAEGCNFVHGWVSASGLPPAALCLHASDHKFAPAGSCLTQFPLTGLYVQKISLLILNERIFLAQVDEETGKQ